MENATKEHPMKPARRGPWPNSTTSHHLDGLRHRTDMQIDLAWTGWFDRDEGSSSLWVDGYPSGRPSLAALSESARMTGSSAASPAEARLLPGYRDSTLTEAGGADVRVIGGMRRQQRRKRLRRERAMRREYQASLRRKGKPFAIERLLGRDPGPMP